MIAGRFMLRPLRCRSRFARPSPDIFWCDVCIVGPYDSIVRGVLREKNARLARRSHGSEPMMPQRSMRDIVPFANKKSISRLFTAVVFDTGMIVLKSFSSAILVLLTKRIDYRFAFLVLLL
jgi:hypothetical protein